MARMIRLFVLGLAWLLAMPAHAEGMVHILLGDPGPAYQEAAEAFRAGLGGRRPLRVWNPAELNAAQLQVLSRGGDLLVPVGLKTARMLAEQHGGRAPVLTLLLPRAAAEQLPWPASLPRNRVSHVYIDQPAARTLGLLDMAFPNLRRIGLVVSDENQSQVRQLLQEALRRKQELVVETIDSADGLAPALRRLLPTVDALLLVPDSLAINSGNAQNVLLTTYRYRVPVMGFSQGLSKAGAIASVYSSPAQIGRQGAQMAVRWLHDEGELPPAQSAGEFSLAFNARVGRSMGLAMPDEADIRRKLGARDE